MAAITTIIGEPGARDNENSREEVPVRASTAGGATAMLGIAGLATHAWLTLITSLGSNLASTPDNRVSDVSNTFWMVALYGTLAAACTLVILLVWWTKPLAISYAAVWIALIGCYWTAWIFNAGDDWTDNVGFLPLEAALPLTSSAFAIYGVWKYRSEPPMPHGTVSSNT